jgi:CRISPR/Cas system-associated protein Csm6
MGRDMAGRPRKTAEENRGNVLRIRLTEAERTELDDAAHAKALDTSSWARSLLLDFARKSASRISGE